MRIAVIGTGYVGLVSGTCFADSGNNVTCVDINAQKIEMLKRGEIPIYEPGLSELVLKNYAAGRLLFTTDSATAVSEAQMVYLAVGTPSGDDGAADLSALWAVVKAIAPHLTRCHCGDEKYGSRGDQCRHFCTPERTHGAHGRCGE